MTKRAVCLSLWLISLLTCFEVTYKSNQWSGQKLVYVILMWTLFFISLSHKSDFPTRHLTAEVTDVGFIPPLKNSIKLFQWIRKTSRPDHFYSNMSASSRLQTFLCDPRRSKALASHLVLAAAVINGELPLSFPTSVCISPSKLTVRIASSALPLLNLAGKLVVRNPQGWYQRRGAQRGRASAGPLDIKWINGERGRTVQVGCSHHYWHMTFKKKNLHQSCIQL